MRRSVIMLSLLAVLAGCETLTDEECLAADWVQIGIADGAEGRSPDHIEAHRRACASAGVSPDMTAWLRGRERGLRLYCVPEKAYQVGRRGGSIREGCTAAELARMEPAWDWGRNYWRLELDIQDIRSDIRAIDSEIAALPPDASKRSALFARRSMLRSRLGLLELRQRRYATWP